MLPLISKEKIVDLEPKGYVANPMSLCSKGSYSLVGDTDLENQPKIVAEMRAMRE